MKKGLENEPSAETRMAYTEKRESEAPTMIIKADKYLPIFMDALETSNASTPVVSLRRGSSFRSRSGGATTISFLLLFFGISPTNKHLSEMVKKSWVCAR